MGPFRTASSHAGRRSGAHGAQRVPPGPHLARPTARRRAAQRELQADARLHRRADRPPGLRARRLVVPEGSRLDAPARRVRTGAGGPSRRARREGPQALHAPTLRRRPDLSRAGQERQVRGGRGGGTFGGETLAAIGSITFANPGWLAPGPTVTDPLLPGPDPMPRFVDQCLASPMVQRRAPAELIERTHTAMWSHAAALPPGGRRDLSGSRRLRWAQPPRPAGGGPLGRGGSSRLGVRGFRLTARRRRALPAVRTTRPANCRAALPSRLPPSRRPI